MSEGPFGNVTVTILGDVILDEYLVGRVERLSPEAPVPVLEVQERTRSLGGAANVARNVVALGGQARLCGVRGEDDHGEEILKLCRGLEIDSDGVVISSDRPTTFKQRVIARTQQIVRIDHESVEPLGKDVRDRLTAGLRRAMKASDVVVISDYDKGVISREILEVVQREAGGIPIVVDPNVRHFFEYSLATVVTPNHLQLERVSGKRIRGEKELIEAGRSIKKRLSGPALLVTRGEEGMSLFTGEVEVLKIPTVAREVYDVTGAGDTVVAALALGLGSGWDLVEAARTANVAAGIVVGKRGTAAVSARELRERLDELKGGRD
ncbi:MAG: D-glycero-beta-D-manno-heptose-7-phosphate kinase [Candidatus Hydrogenedentota bacterium]|nr:MAG: D-glycero-beta-D-manno-heptose-7-phosphate kinase [Candidatus Hydrogenedentota bacterium]